MVLPGSGPAVTWVCWGVSPRPRLLPKQSRVKGEFKRSQGAQGWVVEMLTGGPGEPQVRPACLLNQ